MKKKEIKFGTSGHRGILNESFTVAHVKAIAEAISELLPQNSSLVIGYDSREGNSPSLNSGSFTHILTQTLSQNGIQTYVTEGPCPTPVVSWMITEKNLAGGLILTASHNPKEYNGLKFNEANGAPASEETTKKIEALANHYLNTPKEKKLTINAPIIKSSPYSEFANALQKTLTTLIQSYSLKNKKILVDIRHGACGKTWKEISKLENITLTLLHETPRSDFGELDPNPTSNSVIKELEEAVITQKSDMGIANDPDGDRHVIVDDKGSLLSPEETATICMTLLQQYTQLKGAVSTLASSQSVKLCCQNLGLVYEETKVGFKYFTPFLETCKAEKKIGIGVESSGGISLSCHTLEKCGFFPPLLLLALIEKEKKPLSEIRKKIKETLPPFFFKETAYHYKPEEKEQILKKLTSSSDILERQLEEPILNIDTRDGIKLLLSENTWILFRLSGTEPVLRVYVESNSENRTETLLHRAQTLFQT